MLGALRIRVLHNETVALSLRAGTEPLYIVGIG